MSMRVGYCKHCGQKHTFRDLSEGTIRTCANCGKKFTLRRGFPLGYVGLFFAFVVCFIVIAPFVSRTIPPSDQTGLQDQSPAQKSPVTTQQPRLNIAAERDRKGEAQAAESRRKEEEAAAEKLREEREEREKKAAEQKAKKDEATAAARVKIIQQLSDPERRRERLKEVVAQYPNTKAAADARRILATME